MAKHKKILISISLLLFMLSPAPGWAEDVNRDPFFNSGMAQAGGPAMGTVKESVDPFSGYLSLVHTDISLPGKNGLDLNIMRFYNSQLWNRRDTAYPALVAYNDRSPVGLGWKMHMGELVNPDGDSNKSGYFADNPVLEMPDGSVQVFYRQPGYSSSNQKYISKDYWTMVRTDYSNDAKWEVTASDGTKYIYQYDFVKLNPENSSFLGYDKWWGGIRVAQCTQIISANGLSSISIDYEWDSTIGYSFLKTITDSVDRVVTFNYVSTTDRQKLTDVSVSYGGNTFLAYSYEYTTSSYGLYQFYYLDYVVMPDGRKWDYDYNPAASEFDLTKITYPYGGYVSYTYKNQQFYTGGSNGNVDFRVVATRSTGGRGITSPESWTYSYSSPQSGYNITTVTGLNNTVERYQYYGWGVAPSGYVWRVGRPYITEILEGGVVKYREDFSWTIYSANYISYDNTRNPYWNTYQGLVEDTNIYVPHLSAKTIRRDGKSYYTTYTNHDSYGNPQTITERENGTTRRVQGLSYWKNTAKNMVHGKPDSNLITGFSTSALIDYEYFGSDGPTGRIGDLKFVTKYGVTTNYSYYPSGHAMQGELRYVTDANTKTTTYEWDKGRISKITYPTVPEYSIQKAINADGTVHSEQTLGLRFNRNNTVTYTYDNNLRLDYIDRQESNTDTDIIYYTEYYNGNYYLAKKRELRGGGYWTETYYDGLGRVVRTKNKVGLESYIIYGVNGRKSSEYSNSGSTTYFDILGRVDYIQDRKGNVTDYVYSSDANYTIVTVKRPTIAGEEGLPSNDTVLYYYAFGNPDEKLLMKVRDAAGNETSYNYNILGQVTNITQGGVTRSFVYDINGDAKQEGFLFSETHPEKGTITYGRDAVGNLTSRTDQPGVIYDYDGVNRLESIDAMGISFTYDGDTGRATMNSSGADVTYYYDGNNRLDYKVTTIDGTPYTTNYDYDGNDNLTNIAYTSGMNIAYQYATGKNLVTAILKNDVPLVSSIEYCGDSGVNCTYSQNLGQLKQFTYANGITTSLDYNERNMLDDISSGSALNLHYVYDNRGNTEDITVDVMQHFEYDSLDRLTDFDGAWGTGSYTYYPNGNRWTKTVGTTTETYGYISNRLNNITNGNSYGYNDFGDLTSFTTGGVDYTLGFDDLHRLESYSDNTGILGQYTYDGDGNRITKTADSKTITYHYDEGGNVLSESNQNGLFEADYVYLYGKLIAMVLNLPNAPSNLAGKALSLADVQLTWVDNSNNETGFRIERSSSSGGPFSTITTVSPGTMEFIDTALAEHSLYYYRVVAFNDRGDSDPSNTVHVKTEDYIISPSWSPEVTNTPFVNITAGSISPSGNITVYYGSDSTFDVLPGFEHHIKNVVIDGTPLGPYNTYIFNFSHTFTNITSDHTIHADFEINSYKLDTKFSGIGFGTITSVPSGIFCQSDCEELYEYGTEVKLSAISTENYVFDSWLGSGCTGTGDCIVTVDENKTVTAKFDCPNQPVRILADPVESSSYFDSLQLAYNSAPDGSIIESQAVDFPDDFNLTDNKMVSLRGGLFCDYSTVIGNTRLSSGNMNVNSGNVTASNYAIGAPGFYHTLDIIKQGVADGYVSSDPKGIDCGTDCVDMYEHGTRVILTATAGNNSTFVGWSSAGCNGDGLCDMLLDANTNVVAKFACNTLATQVIDGTTNAVRGSYATLQEAYGAALDGDIIKSHGIELPGELNMASDKIVTFEGGYNCDYTEIVSDTLIPYSAVNISSGSVIMNNFWLYDELLVEGEQSLSLPKSNRYSCNGANARDAKAHGCKRF